MVSAACQIYTAAKHDADGCLHEHVYLPVYWALYVGAEAALSAQTVSSTIAFHVSCMLELLEVFQLTSKSAACTAFVAWIMSFCYIQHKLMHITWDTSSNQAATLNQDTDVPVHKEAVSAA